MDIANIMSPGPCTVSTTLKEVRLQTEYSSGISPYHQLAQWCWGFLGKEVWIVLPACSAYCIQTYFPPSRKWRRLWAVSFVGFRDAK